MEQYRQMTRGSAKKFIGLILRRWYWLVIFAALFAAVFLYLFWYRYGSMYSVTSTFIPVGIDSGQASPSGLGLYGSLVKNGEVLSSTANSLGFVSADNLADAISVDTDLNSATVRISLVWADREQAAQIMSALRANIELAVPYSAGAVAVRWLDTVSAADARPLSASVPYFQIFILGVLAGLFIGAGFSLLLGVSDKRVFILESVDYGGNVSVIGAIARRENPDAPSGRPDKQFFPISLYLNRLMEEHDKKFVMCTSPVGSCGTGDVALNIAKIISSLKKNILIVTLQKDPGTPAPEPELRPVYPGVYEFLLRWNESESEISLVDSVLSLLPLAAEEFNLILFDSPALLENVQCSMLVKNMDSTLLVCQYGKTKYTDVQSAVSLLTRAGASHIYCVWNDADKHYSEYYFPIESNAV